MAQPKTKAIDTKAVQITEKVFRQQVIDLAKVFKWKVYFTWNSLHSPAGFPDLVLVWESRKLDVPNELLFIELKSEKGRLTPAQCEWINALKSAKQDVRVFRPSDWDDILLVLKRPGGLLLEAERLGIHRGNIERRRVKP